MPYNPNFHHRRTIRLKGYDYSRAGLYFITSCCQGRVCHFGTVTKGQMQKNAAGEMVENQWMGLKNRFPHIRLHEWIVMPNHFHGIIEILNTVGAPLVGAQIVGAHDTVPQNLGQPQGHAPTGAENAMAPTIGDIMDAFKSLTTVEYIRGVKNCGWAAFKGKLWQRNYYEHIIRNEQAYHTISTYILNNPASWDQDSLNRK